MEMKKRERIKEQDKKKLKSFYEHYSQYYILQVNSTFASIAEELTRNEMYLNFVFNFQTKNQMFDPL